MQNKIKSYYIAFILGFYLLFSFHAFAHEYVSHSVLKNGNWVKIRIERTGVCKITYEEIKSMGLNPENIRVYGYGGAELDRDFSKKIIEDLPPVPIYISKGTDGVFNKGDFILFYVQGPIKWIFDGCHFHHTLNTYSKYGHYFLSDNGGVQHLIENTITPQENVANATTISSYVEHLVHEQDIVNLIDVEGQSGGGKTFYGEKIPNNASLNIPFYFNGVIHNSLVDFKCDIAAVSSANVNITITVNGINKQITLRPLTRNGSFTEQATTGSLQDSFKCLNSDGQIVNISVSSTFSTANAYLNYIEMSAHCSLIFNNSFMNFRTTTNYLSDKYNQYVVSNANGTMQIWDVTALDAIHMMPTSFNNNEITFIGSNKNEIHEYVAVDPQGKDFVPYTFVKKVETQDLHGLQPVYDMVIITPPQFEEHAWRLAHLHESIDDLDVIVVTDDAVYNEFSSGTPDASSYRHLAKMLYDRGQLYSKTLSHLLLFGDGSFDNRSLLPNSGSHCLLTYQSDNSVDELKGYVTDDYFGFLGDNSGINDIADTMQIAVGRLPINTTTEATNIVNKIEHYMQNQNVGQWKNQLLFLADDGDAGQHLTASDEIAEAVRKYNPNFVVNKIYLDAFVQTTTASGEKYPMANSKLNNLLSSGILYMNYSGHGSATAITNEKTLLKNDIDNMYNSKLGFWMLATCSFGHFDGNKKCCAEAAVLNPKGGAIAVLSATRTVYASQNSVLNKFFCEALFSTSDSLSYNITIGQASQIAKNKCVTKGASVAENKMAYVLLGDPALKLNFPTHYKIHLSTKKDTLRALDIDTLTGYITEQKLNGGNTLIYDTVQNFNGKVHLTILDKMNRYQTFDNDESNPEKKYKFEYNDYTSSIFKGKAPVTNGKFSLVYRIPKDIKYNYGKGRIVAYAFDTTTLDEIREAMGHNENFIVGGSSFLDNNTDNQGPVLTVYLNNPAFKNGQTTFQSPRFFAEIYDESGINTTGNGIGHDLTLIVDNDINKTYNLNEYYSSYEGSYQQGIADFLLSDLNEGKHTLTFRAWDMLNNSSTANLDFVVSKNLNPQIYTLTAYPNPVERGGTLYFFLDYDRNDYLCNITMYIYDITGKLLYSRNMTNENPLQFDLSSINLSTGIYLYKFMINSQNTKYTTKMGKIIVK